MGFLLCNQPVTVCPVYKLRERLFLCGCAVQSDPGTSILCIYESCLRTFDMTGIDLSQGLYANRVTLKGFRRI
jgi:hypothetical protein